MRDQSRCVRCGMMTPGHWHHRRSRSIRDDITHSPCNGINLCGTCHDWVHAHPFEARAQGWIVSRYKDPRQEPINHFLFGWVLLTEDGGWASAPAGCRVEPVVPPDHPTQ
jgi:hypothetical protein